MNVNVGDWVKVKYSTGEYFAGEVKKVRAMPEMVEVFGMGATGTLQNRILFTVYDETAGYRSLYRDKCESFAVLFE